MMQNFEIEIKFYYRNDTKFCNQIKLYYLAESYTACEKKIKNIKNNNCLYITIDECRDKRDRHLTLFIQEDEKRISDPLHEQRARRVAINYADRAEWPAISDDLITE